ncbi:MAG: GNAT family N-acetyltransferase [Luteibaculum sp.]
MEFKVRESRRTDVPQILELIKELARYEKAEEEVAISEETLIRDGFEKERWFTCVVADIANTVVGFALFYPKYSTWKGKALYLEDLLVSEKHRRGGIGEELFKTVVQRARLWGCQRMEWQVLDWNEPAIEFYKKMGADLDPTWINGKLFPNDFSRILGAEELKS